MLLVLAQAQREHSEGKEILQGGVAGDGSCWVLVSIPTSRVSLLRDLQGTGPGEVGGLSSTCMAGNARLHENVNISWINRKNEGKSKNT